MDPVAEAIDAVHAGARRGDPPRSYIGASIVGHACEAMLAFSLRGYPDTPPGPQAVRIFREGHRLEDQVIADLKAAGFLVWEKDPQTGKQFEYEEFGHHVVGHADGHIELDHRWPGTQQGEVALLEIKSMNDNKWTDFTKKGVRASHPQYYWQVQLMMGLSGIEKALFVVYNKNNSKYASELVLFSDADFSFLKQKIQKVLANQATKISKDESDWRCRWCFKQKVCWGKELAPRSCKTCAHAAADPDHGWWCLKHKAACEQPCADHAPYMPKDAP